MCFKLFTFPINKPPATELRKQYRAVWRGMNVDRTARSMEETTSPPTSTIAEPQGASWPRIDYGSSQGDDESAGQDVYTVLVAKPHCVVWDGRYNVANGLFFCSVIPSSPTPSSPFNNQSDFSFGLFLCFSSKSNIFLAALIAFISQ